MFIGFVEEVWFDASHGKCRTMPCRPRIRVMTVLRHDTGSIVEWTTVGTHGTSGGTSGTSLPGFQHLASVRNPYPRKDANHSIRKMAKQRRIIMMAGLFGLFGLLCSGLLEVETQVQQAHLGE